MEGLRLHCHQLAAEMPDGLHLHQHRPPAKLPKDLRLWQRRRDPSGGCGDSLQPRHQRIVDAAFSLQCCRLRVFFISVNLHPLCLHCGWPPDLLCFTHRSHGHPPELIHAAGEPNKNPKGRVAQRDDSDRNSFKKVFLLLLKRTLRFICDVLCHIFYVLLTVARDDENISAVVTFLYFCCFWLF